MISVKQNSIGMDGKGSKPTTVKEAQANAKLLYNQVMSALDATDALLDRTPLNDKMTRMKLERAKRELLDRYDKASRKLVDSYENPNGGLSQHIDAGFAAAASGDRGGLTTTKAAIRKALNQAKQPEGQKAREYIFGVLDIIVKNRSKWSGAQTQKAVREYSSAVYDKVLPELKIQNPSADDQRYTIIYTRETGSQNYWHFNSLAMAKKQVAKLSKLPDAKRVAIVENFPVRKAILEREIPKRNPARGEANPRTRRIFQVDLSDDSRLAILALSQEAADNLVAKQAKREGWKSVFDGKPITVVREKRRNGSNTRTKTANPARGEADEGAARELYLFASNDGQLMRSQGEPIHKNLITKKARGVYKTELAVKLAMYLMENAAKKYAREFGGTWNDMFNVPTRREAAKEFVEHFEGEADLGNYDNYLPKKYQKNHTANDFHAFKENRSKEHFKMFQGKQSSGAVRVLQPDSCPDNTSRLGDLVLMKVIKSNGSKQNINFNGEAFLAIDLRKNLWAIGKDARINNVALPRKGELKYLGKLKQIDYVTAKKHIGGNKLTRFWHELGEVDKNYPSLYVDADGFPIIHGGGYDVWNIGIVN